jgi:hypothetical protein
VVENVRVTPPLRAEPIFDELGFFNLRWSEYFEETADTINVKQHDDDAFQSLNPSASAISALSKRISDLELLTGLMPNLSGFARQLTVVSVSADYTSVGNEIIICTNSNTITITLNANPNNKDQILIKRTNGPVIVTSTKGIDGITKKGILNKFDSPHMVFTVEADEYSII